MVPAKLLAQLSHPELFTTLQHHVQAYMARFDASHDFAHIERVLALADRIRAGELSLQNAQGLSRGYDADVVFLAA